MDAYLVRPVLLKRGRTVAKCDLWIHWATQGLAMDGPFDDQWVLQVLPKRSESKGTDDSTGALIPYVRVANIAVTVKNLIVFFNGLGHFYYTSWEGMIKTFTIDSCCLRIKFRGQYSEIKISVEFDWFHGPSRLTNHPELRWTTQPSTT